jgi:chromosomal replication initiation ATPase DnaA
MDKNIIWIYGKTGSGKTTFIKKITQGKNVCPFNSHDFISAVLDLLRKNKSIDPLIDFCKKYDFLILDDFDINVKDKPATQKEMRDLIIQIASSTKIILSTILKPSGLKILKFQNKICKYIGFKVPEVTEKNKLIKAMTKANETSLTQLEVSKIINSSKNLFRMKGLLNKIFLSKKLQYK